VQKSLNGMIVQRWLPAISKDVETHLSKIFSKCVIYSLDVDESTDITSTVQMCIFMNKDISAAAKEIVWITKIKNLK
jgi:hypothetical protein